MLYCKNQVTWLLSQHNQAFRPMLSIGGAWTATPSGYFSYFQTHAEHRTTSRLWQLEAHTAPVSVTLLEVLLPLEVVIAKLSTDLWKKRPQPSLCQATSLYLWMFSGKYLNRPSSRSILLPWLHTLCTITVTTPKTLILLNVHAWKWS